MNLKRLADAALHACASVVLLTTALTACRFLRTPPLLDLANKPPAPESQPQRKAMAARISLIVRTHMVDGYVYPETVALWLDEVSKHPEPVINMLCGLAEKPGANPATLYDHFNRAVSPDFPKQDSVWKIPAPPLSTENGIVGLGELAKPFESDQNELKVGVELDAERFVSNARAIAQSLFSLESLRGKGHLSDEDLREGIQGGVELAKGYLKKRHWSRRVGRPTTAIVISGGSANGAFSAGFLWRLTDVLQTCKAASGDRSCPQAGIDLAVGTSTGSLIGVMLDVYSTKDQEQRGRDLMLRNYTCSTPAEVYCVNDVWFWKLFQDTRGLVQFDGLRKKLNEMLADAQLDNDMELVTMAVDFETGDLLAESDQDPADGPADGQAKHTRVDARIDAILASGAIPVLTDPIDRPGQQGTFVDGGVRSDVPAMEAIRRGAERVLVIKSSGLDSDPQPRQRHAGKMLARAVDLFVDQVAASEIQQATLFATARRLGEYNLCEYRLRAADKTEEIREERDLFCKREFLALGVAPARAKGLTRRESAETKALAQRESAETRFMGPVPTSLGPDVFAQVAQSFKSAWVVRPEGAVSLTGYQVDPPMMRDLFNLGIKTFQAHCPEVLRLLDIPEAVRQAQCTSHAESAALKRAEAEMGPLPKAGGVKKCKR